MSWYDMIIAHDDYGLEFLLAFDGRIHHLDEGYEALLDDFFDEVERTPRERGVGLQVVRAGHSGRAG